MVELTWDTAGALTLAPLWGHSALCQTQPRAGVQVALPAPVPTTQNSPYQSSPTYQPTPPNCHLISLIRIGEAKALTPTRHTAPSTIICHLPHGTRCATCTFLFQPHLLGSLTHLSLGRTVHAASGGCEGQKGPMSINQPL